MEVLTEGRVVGDSSFLGKVSWGVVAGRFMFLQRRVASQYRGILTVVVL